MSNLFKIRDFLVSEDVSFKGAGIVACCNYLEPVRTEVISADKSEFVTLLRSF